MVGVVVRSVAAVALVLSGASSVLACPICQSEAGKQVRRGIFDANFEYHLAVTVLPFLVFMAIVGLIHFGPPWSTPMPQAVPDSRQGQGETSVDHAAKDQSWTTY